MKTSQHHKLLALQAITSIHAGSGQSLDVIDLPIMREKHTGYPVIFGSAVKGAMRAHAVHQGLPETTINTIYGLADNATFASSIAIGDAQLLALPMRSLSGHFRLVTCPFALKRFLNIGIQTTAIAENETEQFNLPEISSEHILIGEHIARESKSETASFIYLEEFRYQAIFENGLTAWIELLAQAFDMTPEQLQTFSVVSNDQFADLTQVATAIAPHISLSDNKVNKDGALWYEESLPAETLMFSLLMANETRQSEESNLAIMHSIEQQLADQHRYLQVGGNETVGMGWCRTHLYPNQR